MADDLDNPRDVELSSLCAIYPELQQLHPDDPYTIALDVPVNPSKAVTVFFPAVADDALPPSANGATNGAVVAGPDQQAAVDSHELAHLPSLRLEITVGPRYPAEQPPQVAISTNPPWLPAETVRQLQEDASRLWEEIGRDIVGFTYIDHVQQAAENVFGLVDEKGSLAVDSRHKIAILDYDIQARKAAFEKETFDCGVCLEPKKGSVCHRMLDCGHVFCVACLQDFYNNAIKEGDIAAVKCLAPNCAKERAKVTSSSGRKRKKPKTFINPSELLQIPLDQETVKRYVTLKYKTELESDKNTIYCPRQWCNGAARSKKHKRPQGLELAEASDESASEEEDDGDHAEDVGKSKPYKPAEELLAICEECSFAFCSRCYQSWHGEFFRCTPRRDKQELTAEELASIEYMRLHTTPCPTCGAPAQKTHGCNHMICYRCQSHFCYLCSAWLDPGNPYQHFNEAPDGRVTGCYMRLWELEMGDGDDVGIGFAGGPGGVANQALPVPVQEFIPEIEEPEEEAEAHAAGHPAPPPPLEAHADGGQVGIAREGPLVLRIAANQPAAPGRGGPRGRQPAAPAAQPAAPAPGVARGAPGPGARARNQQPAARGGGPQQAAARGGPGAGAGPAAQRGHRAPGAGGVPAGQQRLRGGRGGGAAAGGRPAQRQYPNNNNPANQGGERAQRPNINNADLGDIGEDGELAPVHQDWVRQFVRLALNDEEHILFDGDSDDDI
ncbi:RWD-domain-containing protein [Parathielavia appendiculata]|uniref:RBR-type E3 ubiquitin transferase n=1 Tax=Parathielavia appendiculata TaxID=2587402 RepID=A0AAN6UA43_9PEZI|nr:RWD-domain-containing protein [Parathielavia appendiculata]